LRSKRNRLFFQLRKQIGFTRSGYREYGTVQANIVWQKSLTPAAQKSLQDILECYDLARLQKELSLESWQKNLATLWTLEQFPELRELSGLHSILDAGAHDFQRAPALHAFFSRRNKGVSIQGIELDAFRVLHDLHSRADRAQYFSRLTPGSNFISGDFFTYRSKVDVICAFYPFVSPHPAIAWGLPAEFGSADAWVTALSQNLSATGLALVMHQGSWEEEEFDEVLAKRPEKLQLRRRLILDCPFYPSPYPPHVSLYART
jgi:hypothetical protein